MWVENDFKENMYPSHEKHVQVIADTIGGPYKKVSTWNNNRKTKTRKESQKLVVAYTNRYSDILMPSSVVGVKGTAWNENSKYLMRIYWCFLLKNPASQLNPVISFQILPTRKVDLNLQIN